MRLVFSNCTFIVTCGIDHIGKMTVQQLVALTQQRGLAFHQRHRRPTLMRDIELFQQPRCVR